MLRVDAMFGQLSYIFESGEEMDDLFIHQWDSSKEMILGEYRRMRDDYLAQIL